MTEICTMLCNVALCCAMLRYVVLYCAMLCYVVQRCAMLCYVALCCAMLRCCAILYYVVPCCAMLCHDALCCAMFCYVALRCPMLCYAEPSSLRSWRYGTREITFWLRSHQKREAEPLPPFPSRLRRPLVGSAAKTLFHVPLKYRQLRRLEPSFAMLFHVVLWCAMLSVLCCAM